MITTTNGSFEILLKKAAGMRALGPITRYSQMLASGGETAMRSTVDNIAAGASVVGAIAGLAALRKSSGKTGVFELDVLNMSDQPVTPYEFETSRCCLQEAPRPILTGDHTLIRGSWADGFAAKNSLGPSVYDGLIMGVGFTCVLLLLAAFEAAATATAVALAVD